MRRLLSRWGGVCGGAARQTMAVIHTIHSGIWVFNINFHLEVIAAAALC